MDQNGHFVEAFVIPVYSLQICEILKRVYGRQAGAIDYSLRWGYVRLEEITSRNIIVNVFVFACDLNVLYRFVMMHM